MWKDFVAINGSECVRALICIAIDDPLGGGMARSKSSKDGFFGFLSEKKSSLPGGQSHYSLQRTVGGSFGTRG